MFSTISDRSLKPLPLSQADLRYAETFLDKTEADTALNALIQQVPWQQAEIQLFGRKVLTPRLSCWMGEPDAVYRYSNTSFRPEPWNPVVLMLKSHVEAATGRKFNSVLLNYYRNGSDAMGWHSDDEAELGVRPMIASLSLGGVRRFLLRNKSGGKSLGIDLAHGSLLIMQGDTQKHYQHSLPRTVKMVDARINLTFRKIV